MSLKNRYNSKASYFFYEKKTKKIILNWLIFTMTHEINRKWVSEMLLSISRRMKNGWWSPAIKCFNNLFLFIRWKWQNEYCVELSLCEWLEVKEHNACRFIKSTNQRSIAQLNWERKKFTGKINRTCKLSHG